MEQHKPSLKRYNSFKSEKYLPEKQNCNSSNKNSLPVFTSGKNPKLIKNKMALVFSSHSNSNAWLDIAIQKYEREIDETKIQLDKAQEYIQLLRRNVLQSQGLLLKAINQKSPEIQTYKNIHSVAFKCLEQAKEEKRFQFYAAQLRKLREEKLLLNAKRK